MQTRPWERRARTEFHAVATRGRDLGEPHADGADDLVAERGEADDDAEAAKHEDPLLGVGLAGDGASLVDGVDGGKGAHRVCDVVGAVREGGGHGGKHLQRPRGWDMLQCRGVLALQPQRQRRHLRSAALGRALERALMQRALTSESAEYAECDFFHRLMEAKAWIRNDAQRKRGGGGGGGSSQPSARTCRYLNAPSVRSSNTSALSCIARSSSSSSRQPCGLLLLTASCMRWKNDDRLPARQSPQSHAE